MTEAIVAIGVGGNVGSDVEILERFTRARDALTQLEAVDSAPVYRTTPIGPDQPAFLNTVFRIRIANMLPHALLHALHDIERLLGRDRSNETHWGLRPIDLDILLWGSRILCTPELEIPHPHLVHRRFVIAPLIDLFGGDLVVPGTGRTLAQLEPFALGMVSRLST